MGNKDQIATTVESDKPILAERVMYFPRKLRQDDQWTGGHATVGIAE